MENIHLFYLGHHPKKYWNPWELDQPTWSYKWIIRAREAVEEAQRVRETAVEENQQNARKYQVMEQELQ